MADKTSAEGERKDIHISLVLQYIAHIHMYMDWGGGGRDKVDLLTWATLSLAPRPSPSFSSLAVWLSGSIYTRGLIEEGFQVYDMQLHVTMYVLCVDVPHRWQCRGLYTRPHRGDRGESRS